MYKKISISLARSLAVESIAKKKQQKFVNAGKPNITSSGTAARCNPEINSGEGEYDARSGQLGPRSRNGRTAREFVCMGI